MLANMIDNDFSVSVTEALSSFDKCHGTRQF